MTADLFTRLAQRALTVPVAPGGGAGPSPLEAVGDIEVPPAPAAPVPAIVAAAAAADAGDSRRGPPPAEPSIRRPATVAPDWRHEPGVAPGETSATAVAHTEAGDYAPQSTPISDEIVVAVALVRPPPEPPRQPPSTLRTGGEPTGASRSEGAPEDGTSAPPERSVTVFARPRIDPTPPPEWARTDGPAGTGAADPGPAAPVVEITIDRVELRMARGAAPSRSAPPPPPAPALSLRDYLARRQEESG